MKILWIIFQLSFIKRIILYSILNENFNNYSIDDDLSKVFISVIKTIKELYEPEIKNISNVSENCFNFLNKTFFSNEEIEKNKLFLYYLKLALDSSKNKNDISTYNDCMEKRYGIQLLEEDIKNFSYILIFIDKRNNKNHTVLNNDTTYLFAVCAPHQKDGCSDSDYLEIAMKIFEKNLDQINPKKEEVSLFSFENYTGEYQYHFLSFEQIPLYFIILHISFIIFKNIYFKFYQFLFSCCKKEKNDSESPSRKYTLRNRKNTIPNQLNKKTNYQKIFESVFSISKNIEILFSKGNEDEVNNDIGISYIKGIKGLCMIFYLFGTLYFNLYNSPISQKNRTLFFKNLSHHSFCVFYFGMKYSPRILLSCSGFSLFYKMICYFDEKSEEEREDKKKENSNHNFTYYINFQMLFTFILHQIYKYILFLLVTLFIIYSIFLLNLLFIDINPMWVYFKHTKIKSLSISEIICNIFGIQTYFFPERKEDSILNYFWLLYNEIIFFLFTSFILYFVYKYQLKLNRLIIISIIFIEAFKYIFIFFISSKNIRPGYIYTYNNYGKFYVSPLMNYPFFLIGVYFSMFNFVMQKSLNYIECNRQEKTYLSSSVKAIKKLKKFQKCYLYFWGLIFSFFILLLSFSQSILCAVIRYINSEEDVLKTFFQSSLVQIFMLYDTEIIVILFHLLALFFYIAGENFFNSFLTHKYWSILDKIYFSYILLINPVILYILYTGETKIIFSIPNCFFYSSICGIMVFVISICCYIIFELPFKRMTKYMFKVQKNKKKEEILGGMENQFYISQNDGNFHLDSSVEEEKEEMETPG